MLFWITFAVVATATTLVASVIIAWASAMGGKTYGTLPDLAVALAIGVGLGCVAGLIVTGVWTLLAPMFG